VREPPRTLDRRHRWVYQITLGRYYVWACRCCPTVAFTLSKRATDAAHRVLFRAMKKSLPRIVRSIYQPNPLYEVLRRMSA